MNPQLHFAYASAKPSLELFDVKTIHADELAGSPGAFAVIGESHYVGVPGLDFHEVCSCEALSGEHVQTVPLEAGVERAFSFDTGRLDARTHAEVRPLDSFSGDDTADVAHRFGPGAWTTIEIGDDAYETYHTYPEYDLLVYTETTLTPRSAGPNRKRTGDFANERASDPAGEDASNPASEDASDDATITRAIDDQQLQ